MLVVRIVMFRMCSERRTDRFSDSADGHEREREESKLTSGILPGAARRMKVPLSKMGK